MAHSVVREAVGFVASLRPVARRAWPLALCLLWNCGDGGNRNIASANRALTADPCAGQPDLTNVGCATGVTSSGGTNTGPVHCKGGKSIVSVCGPVAGCTIQADGTGRCQAYACDPANTVSYCTADNNFVSCDGEEKRYSEAACGSDSRCDQTQGCVAVKGTPCDPTFKPFCGDGAGGNSVTTCDPQTKTVVVQACLPGERRGTTALGPAACLKPPATGAQAGPAPVALCIDENNIGWVQANGTWQAAKCPDGTQCTWNPVSGQAWCMQTGPVDTSVASATATDTGVGASTVTVTDVLTE